MPRGSPPQPHTQRFVPPTSQTVKTSASDVEICLGCLGHRGRLIVHQIVKVLHLFPFLGVGIKWHQISAQGETLCSVVGDTLYLQ